MPPKSPDAARGPLNAVEEGMEVRDATGESIGTVRDIYLGAPEGISGSPAGGGADQPADTLSDAPLDRLGAALTPVDSLPRELAQRLRQHGFIQIDSSGVFASDRYATADQIASVSTDGVHLTVTRDELLAA